MSKAKSTSKRPKGLSQAAYARHRGCDPREVRRALEAGLIRAMRDGSIDPVRADAAWAAGTNPASAKKPGMKPTETTYSRGDGSGDRTSFTEARTQSELAKAEMSALRLRERQGQLVNRPKAVEAIFALARQEREAWQGWPARVSAVIASEIGADPHRVELALEKHIKVHLRELSAVDPDRVLGALAADKTGRAS